AAGDDATDRNGQLRARDHDSTDRPHAVGACRSRESRTRGLRKPSRPGSGRPDPRRRGGRSLPCGTRAGRSRTPAVSAVCSRMDRARGPSKDIEPRSLGCGVRRRVMTRRTWVVSLAALAASAVALTIVVGVASAQGHGVRNIVLVHGAWADGSSWSKVIPLLRQRGLNVTAVQNPLTSFTDDLAAVDRVIALQDGPVLLV